VAAKQAADERRVAELAAGVAAKRLVYKDGGQNPVFSTNFAPPAEKAALPYSAKEYSQRDLGTVSRPDALVGGPQEIAATAGGPVAARH
jgi:hypothetical protein